MSEIGGDTASISTIRYIYKTKYFSNIFNKPFIEPIFSTQPSVIDKNVRTSGSPPDSSDK